MPLTRDQERGIREYQLTEKQVTHEGFGFHTLEAIDVLRKRDKDLPIIAAYEQVKDYTSTQAFALKIGYDIEQMKTTLQQGYVEKVAGSAPSSGYHR